MKFCVASSGLAHCRSAQLDLKLLGLAIGAIYGLRWA